MADPPEASIELSIEQEALAESNTNEIPDPSEPPSSKTTADNNSAPIEYILTPPSSVASHEPLEYPIHEHTYATEQQFSKGFFSLASFVWSIEDTSDGSSVPRELENMILADARSRGQVVWRMELKEKLCQMAVQDRSLADMYALITRMEREMSRRAKLILVLEAVESVELGELESLQLGLWELDDIASRKEDGMTEEQPTCREAVAGQFLELTAVVATQIEGHFVSNQGDEDEIEKHNNNPDQKQIAITGEASNEGLGGNLGYRDGDVSAMAMDLSETKFAEDKPQEQHDDNLEPREENLAALMADHLICLVEKRAVRTDSSFGLEVDEIIETSSETKTGSHIDDTQGKNNAGSQEGVIISDHADPEDSMQTDIYHSDSPQEDTRSRIEDDIQLQPDCWTLEIQIATPKDFECQSHTINELFSSSLPINPALKEEGVESAEINLPHTSNQSTAGSIPALSEKRIDSEEITLKPTSNRTTASNTAVFTIPASTGGSINDEKMDILYEADRTVTDSTACQINLKLAEDDLPLDELAEDSSSEDEESMIKDDQGTPSTHDKLSITDFSSLMESVKTRLHIRGSSAEIFCSKLMPDQDARVLDLATTKDQTKFPVCCNQTCQVFTNLLSTIQRIGVSPADFCRALLYQLCLLPGSLSPDVTEYHNEYTKHNFKTCKLIDKVNVSRSLVKSLTKSLDYYHEQMSDAADKESDTLAVKLEEQQQNADRLLADPTYQGSEEADGNMLDVATMELDDTTDRVEQQRKLEVFLAGISDLIKLGRQVLQHANFEDQPSPAETTDNNLTPSKNKNKKKKKKSKKKRKDGGQPAGTISGFEIPDKQTLLPSDTIKSTAEKMISVLEHGRQFLVPAVDDENSASKKAGSVEAMVDLEKIISELRAVASNPRIYEPVDAAIGEITIEKYQDLVAVVAQFYTESVEAKKMSIEELEKWLSTFAEHGIVNTQAYISDLSAVARFTARIMIRSRELNCKRAAKATADSQIAIHKLTEEATNQTGKLEEYPEVFGFAEYLKKLFPEEVWTFERLPNSITNYTVRATRQSDGETDYKTCILKHAPPCDAPASIDRQEREAYALKHFATFGKPGTASRDTVPLVLVAALIFYDDANHVLSMHDLGISGTLPDALEGFRISHSELSNQPIDQLVPHFQSIGYDIGVKFASFHSPLTKTTLEKSPCKIRRIGEVNGLPPHMGVAVDKYLQKFGISESDELGKRAVEDYEAKFDDEFEVFAFGDASLSSILIDYSAHVESRKGLVDFECCGWGRGLNGDMAQLFAEMLLYLTAPRPTFAIQCIVRSMMTGMADGYRMRSRTANSPLSTGRAKTINDFGGKHRRLPPKVARALRSLYIACGGELLYLASNLPRVCLCCIPGEAENCEWVRRTVELGAMCLRVAGRDEYDFQSAKNWKVITDSSALQSWLLKLVFGD